MAYKLPKYPDDYPAEHVSDLMAIRGKLEVELESCLGSSASLLVAETVVFYLLEHTDQIEDVKHILFEDPD
tara:strand:+ start:417 stop:629 length:213 start_codon:yes stop_codon:yes gene_type:complete